MPAPAKRLYFPTLDGLRACGFILVFLHHLPRSLSPTLGLIQDHGWVGVHIFLFLSAYLLTAILQTEQATQGRIFVGRFLVRRALRIWPLYFAFCGASAAYLFLKGSYQPSDLPHLIGLATFTENWVDGVTRSYSSIPYTSPLWTISLEEQFYLVLPWLLSLWLAARTRRPLVVGVTALWALFIGVRAIAVMKALPHPFIWTSLFSADSLLLGTLLGAFHYSIHRRFVREACFLAGVAALATMDLFPPIQVCTSFRSTAWRPSRRRSCAPRASSHPSFERCWGTVPCGTWARSRMAFTCTTTWRWSCAHPSSRRPRSVRGG